MSLKKLIEQQNKVKAIFGLPAFSNPITTDDCDKLFQILEGQLSPEVLHCDGEITAAAARKKYVSFVAAWKELETIQGAQRICMSADIAR